MKKAKMKKIKQCWCGNKALVPFSPGYLRCSACETLIAAEILEVSRQQVKDDDADFYGRDYWFAHQEKDLGYPNILDRAQTDLSERCVHWLNTILYYKLPLCKALELGSAHGGFVALLRWAGFDATGLELSPWVVENARKIFGIPTLLGPVENQKIEPDSLDIIAMMDVLEHLPNPTETLRHCLNLLKRDGILFIQTPRFQEAKSFNKLVEQNDPFLEQLKAKKRHLYLFSASSICEFFSRLGCDFVQFVPAVFSHYDMSLIASRVSLVKHSPDEIQKSLIKSPEGRLIQALLYLSSQFQDLVIKYKESEADRSVRLVQVKKLTRLLKESEKDRKARSNQIKDLVIKYKESEADRSARLVQVKKLTRLLKESEKDRAERLRIFERLEAKILDLKNRLALEARKALEVEKGWRSLEKTFAVRGARKIGLIKVKRLDSSLPLNKSQEIKRSDKEI